MSPENCDVCPVIKCKRRVRLQIDKYNDAGVLLVKGAVETDFVKDWAKFPDVCKENENTNGNRCLGIEKLKSSLED